MSGSTSLVAPPLIEQIRSNHEEIERLEQFVMKELMTEHLSPMKHLFQGHRLRSMTKSIILKTENLVETYAAAIPAETEPFHGQIALWTNVSYNFYSRLEQIYQYHGDFSSGRPFDADEVLKDEPAIAFCVEALVDTWTCMLCTNYTSTLILGKKLNILLTLMSSPNQRKYRVKLSLRGITHCIYHNCYTI